jgi:hypothetical protein
MMQERTETLRRAFPKAAAHRAEKRPDVRIAGAVAAIQRRCACATAERMAKDIGHRRSWGKLERRAQRTHRAREERLALSFDNATL